MSLFMRRGKSATYFVPTIANTAAPTVAEITAGVDLSAAVAALNGFETSQNRINQVVQKYRSEQQIAGPEQFPDVSIVLVEDDGTGSDADSVARQAAQAAVVEDATGYVVLLRSSSTPIAAGKCDVYTVSTGAVNPSYSLDAEPARYTANYFVGAYKKNAVIA